MKSASLRTVSIGALTVIGGLVALNTQPSKKRAVYWGVTDQLDQMNGAIEVDEELRYIPIF